MMLSCQKDRFELDPLVTYLNGAYMSPSLAAVTKAGLHAVSLKSNPQQITLDHFFGKLEALRQLVADFIGCKDVSSICFVPSVSYGMANFVNNIKAAPENNIVIVKDQFPSNYYCWKELADNTGAHLEIVDKPDQRATWTEAILRCINAQTAVISIPHVHWADGSVFDLEAIIDKGHQYGALVILDLTQSLGAYPFDLQKYKVDGFVCASYKWMLGPYSFGFCYLSETFHSGVPLEQSWMNRMESDDFKNLVNYQSKYRPGARRFEVGEPSQFISVAMATAALRQLHEWPAEGIQSYCKAIAAQAVEQLQSKGFEIAASSNRSHHLFGIKPPAGYDITALQKELQREQIYVSYRGDYIRVSPHLYNEVDDFNRLASILVEKL